MGGLNANPIFSALLIARLGLIIMTNYMIFILQIIASLLSAYLIYYSQQKGKNQAEKEDLQKLTEIVEQVKLKNNEELELLKSSLSLLSSKHLQIFGDEKNAIIIFFSQLNKWIWGNLNIHLNEFNHTNYSDLTRRVITMRDAYNEVNVSFSKVQLLVLDDNLVIGGHKTILEALKLHQFIELLTFRLIRNLSDEKIIVEQIVSNKIDFQKIPKEIQAYLNSKAKGNENERELILNEFHENQQSFFAAVLQEVHSFKELSKSYLRK